LATVTAPDAADAVIFGREGLDRLVEVLIACGYQVIGPTVRDSAIVLDKLDSAAALPAGWGVDTAPGRYRLRRREDTAVFANSAGPQSWKQFLHPPRRQLWSAGPDGEFRPAEPMSPRYAFLGVRGCDLAAIGILGQVLGRGAHPDGSFTRAWQGLFVVAVNCTEPGGVCFCASMGTGPAAGPGYDLALTEQIGPSGHWFVAETGSEEGARILRKSRAVPPSAGEVGSARRRRRRRAADGPGNAGRGPAGADPGLDGITALGGRRQPLPDLRQLHDGVPHVLLHHDRGRLGSDRGARRAVAALGVVL
jgi:hypothetical protein